jgi:hypothetical protein
MDPFWENAYDGDKDRRYGALAFTALIGCFLSVAVAAAIAAISGSRYSDDFLVVMLVVVAFFTLVLCLSITRWIRGRKDRKARLKYSSLSRDELAKARSKLKKEMKFTRPVTYRRETRPARRPPPPKVDTDLRY